ncbi:thioredoxin family protein [Hoeflea prorocentri]|uniref:Thioredoxin family protein n=1 Tax=Hoeflea prorocentri TaxID=1922333 RepID=A0A9X3ZI72_9HYPH|nr:thioredoxin family protein [Hoeflea prorocentri]MCY6382632.1 thioredoxin family protein [Hoeflea prorocentri]MDA5400432.1 thioredoxin family protein [Hoeflea prorocentri]
MLLDTPICDFGWKGPDFTLKDAHGNSFTMSDHLGENGLLIAFVCNHCPYVQAIGHRLAEDAAMLKSEGINVLAVMSNDYRKVPSDGPEFMPQFAAKHGWTFPYLIDEDQSVGKSYDAVCTPDFFGFNKNGELHYRGRLDDAGMGDASSRERELVNAMLQIARTGEGPREQTPSMGCSIKWSD